MDESKQKNLVTSVGLLCGIVAAALFYFRFFEFPINGADYMAPRDGMFGKDCHAAVGQWQESDSFATVVAREHEFRPARMPYKTVIPKIIVPPGGYLIAKCPLDFSKLRPTGFAFDLVVSRRPLRLNQIEALLKSRRSNAH